MENYTNPQTPGLEREKSVYLVHLDSVRIAILACMLVGVIAVSFLIGMHISGQSGDDIYGDSSIRGTSLASAEVPATDDLLAKDEAALPLLPGDSKISANDLIAQPPAETAAASSIDKVVPKQSEPVKPKQEKQAVSKPKEKPKTVAVTAKPENTQPAHTGYSVQIGSFDTKDKANVELNRLKRLSYQPFIDKADVNGKTYYRVKIGPLSSKSAAINTMNDLQAIDKYRDSFIVYQK